ncbi:MAG: hypothetical protein NC200_05565 [Candidatus Gastranaerophilales bacterium]|nr:hypothetical protein [Candidatus Gastranaerophilales bacterium]
MKDYDLHLHEDCKILSQAVYQKDKPKNINGWEYVDKYYNNQTGFYSELYKKGDKVILVIRGTELDAGKTEATKDLWNDMEMGLAFLPNQIKDAKSVYFDLVKQYGKENITVTGHSLGGSESAILGTEFGVNAVTFNAYGIKYLYSLQINYTDNITNYGNASDEIFLTNIDAHIGKIMILNANGEGESFYKNKSPYINLEDHKLENLAPLSEAKEYKKEYFEQDKTPLFKTGIEYITYDDNIFNKNNRILHDKEININNADKELIDLYLKQYYSIKKIPSKEDLDKRTYLGELIYVEEYQRSDGTVVSGYYRRFPKN